jgi:hypothetical protein
MKKHPKTAQKAPGKLRKAAGKSSSGKTANNRNYKRKGY